jgi:hypothetical protein
MRARAAQNSTMPNRASKNTVFMPSPLEYHKFCKQKNNPELEYV